MTQFHLIWIILSSVAHDNHLANEELKYLCDVLYRKQTANGRCMDISLLFMTFTMILKYKTWLKMHAPPLQFKYKIKGFSF